MPFLISEFRVKRHQPSWRYNPKLTHSKQVGLNDKADHKHQINRMTPTPQDSNYTQPLRASELLEQHNALPESNAKPCPCCAAESFPHEERCKNCASPLAWDGGVPRKQSKEESFAKTSASKPTGESGGAIVQKKGKDTEKKGHFSLIFVIFSILISLLILKSDPHGGFAQFLKFILEFISKFH